MSHVNDDRKYVFIHVPKTGGSSMARIFKGCGHRTIEQLHKPGYFSFGFVRNPYDRLVSVYHAGLQHGGKWPELQRQSFADFVRRLPEDWQVKPHAYPMTRFLCRGGEVAVDFVGRFERIRADFALICSRLNMTADLPHTNATEHKPWPELYTPELTRIVNDLYAADFETFGYETP